jgi:hypothetical protein
MSDFEDAAAASEPYEVVAADVTLGADTPTGWVLVELHNEPLAFLSPDAVAATAGERPLEYLRELSAGYAADLGDSPRLFHERLESSDPGRPVVVFDSARLQRLGISVPLELDLAGQYCELGYDPRPPKTCGGCICVAGQAQA